MKRIVLLDAGHGGLIDGEYVTPGKRSPIWEDGSQYFEGVGNRLIREELGKLLAEEGIDFAFVNEGNEDVPLGKRVAMVNERCKELGASNVLLVSIHSDGFTSPKAEGWSVFTSKGETESDVYASALYDEIKPLFPGRKMRTDFTNDGDADKEANFFVLRKSHCPAILSENFFHTNEYECRKILMTDEGRYAIALAHFRMIQKAWV